MSEVESFFADQRFWSKASYQFWKAIATGFVRLMTRMTEEGRENLPKTGAYVLAPIHRSYVDTPIAAGVTRRRMRFMGKDTMWKNRPFGWLLSSVGGFPVTRGTTDIEALKRCIHVLSIGEPLVMFPEGERKSGHIVQPLFEGAAYVACRGRVPVIPVGIGGSERVMPKGAKFIYPRRVHVIVGKPIYPVVDERGRAPRTEVKRLTAELHAELQVLFDAAQAHVGLLAASPEPIGTICAEALQGAK